MRVLITAFLATIAALLLCAAGGANAAPRHVTLVALGDSIPYEQDCGGCTGYVRLYGRRAARALRVPAEVKNLAVHNNLNSAASSGTVVCKQKSSPFSGTAYDFIVPLFPHGELCEVSGATITHDLIVQSGAGVAIAQTTIGADLLAHHPYTVQTGHTGPGEPTGPVTIGHDFLIEGSAPREAFHGLCDLHVGNDVRITDLSVTFGITIGDDEVCAAHGMPPDTIDHDLIFTANAAIANPFAIPSTIDIGNNTIGHDLVVTGNSALAPGGHIEVSDNAVGNDAICALNNPAPTADAAGDGPNTVGGINTCG